MEKILSSADKQKSNYVSAMQIIHLQIELNLSICQNLAILKPNYWHSKAKLKSYLIQSF